MNILDEEIESIAERIKMRLIAKGPHCVYVTPTGTVALYQLSDSRNETCPPAYMIGSYTRKATCANIEDDLMARRRELAA